MNKTIICVDDDRTILDSLKSQLLERVGYEVSVEIVESGEEALFLIDDLLKDGEEIPVIISDQQMPDMKGDELLIKAHSKIPKTNKILLTGSTEAKGFLSLVNQINLYRYIPKPWDKTDLYLTVYEALTAYNREQVLQQQYLQLSTLNASLEAKVNDRTEQLAEKTIELETVVERLGSTQKQLMENEKLASLGQLMAGIAHEINTPLGAINASVGSLQDSFWSAISSFGTTFQLLESEEIENFIKLVRQGSEINQIISTKDARAARKALALELEGWGAASPVCMSEKLIDMNILKGYEQFKSLILHQQNELIIGTAFHMINQIKTAKNIEVAIKKASKIVYSLKSYSRFNGGEEKVSVDLKDNLETVLILYNNQIKQGIDVIKNFDDNKVMVNCYPDELIQVWTNIIHNSIHAMDNKGILTIEIEQTTIDATVRISDSGKGIPSEIQSRIFDAFFTTKPTGEGSGLGLDIAKKIVDKHLGSISFISDENGTTFLINLPK